MEEQAYRDAVKQLMNPKLNFNEQLGNWAAGLCGEAAEVDAVIDGAEFMDSIDRDKLKDELSDNRWYATALCITTNKSSSILKPYTVSSFPKTAVQLSRELMRAAGKTNDVIKKIIYHGHSYEKEEQRLREEFMKFVVAYRGLLQKFDFTDEEIKTYNIEKLSARYKDLKFSTEQSVHRNNEVPHLRGWKELRRLRNIQVNSNCPSGNS